jgi:hypothetical protein
MVRIAVAVGSGLNETGQWIKLSALFATGYTENTGHIRTLIPDH